MAKSLAVTVVLTLISTPFILVFLFAASPAGAVENRQLSDDTDNNNVGAAQPVLSQAENPVGKNDDGVKEDETVKHFPLPGDGEGEGAKGKRTEGSVAEDGHKADKNSEEDVEKTKNAGFMHAFIATLSMILVSELGDKTFFIAAIMAMRHSRLTVFAGAMSALALMHVMSALFGTLATLIPRKVTFYLSSGLFAIFGVKMLREGWNMSPDEGKEEYEETQAELKKYEDDQLQARSAVTQDPETGIVRTADTRLKFLVCVSPLFIQAATLNFLAEWGDRSQIAAIVLAARENLFGVILGGLIGHFLCTGLAVIGGRVIAQKLSVRTVTLIGGVVFLLFAVSAFFINPNAT